MGKLLFISFCLSVICITNPSAVAAEEQNENEKPFTKQFRTNDCSFKSEGQNSYFILKPGFQLLFEGKEADATMRFLITVLPETKEFSVPGIGTVTTRVVEEMEWENGKPFESARGFFAICEQTGDVYDFGDEVSIYNKDGSVSHDGTWHAGEPNENGVAMPGIFMPGTFLLGARYYQQLADGLSMERAENIEMGLTIPTEAGTFEQCVRVLETNAIEGDESTVKTHCPGIGLVGEDNLKLIQYGFNIVDLEGK